MSIKGGNQKVESIEVSGKSVDEAVMQALSRLGKRRDEVEITVLQLPSRGAFGIGSKEARVRVSVRTGNLSAVITPEMADAILGPDETFPEEELYMEDEEEEGEFEDEDEEEYEEGELEEEKQFISSTSYIPELSSDLGLGDVSVAEGEMQEVEVATREYVEITFDVLQHILRYMNIHATVQVRSTNPFTLNIHVIHENLGSL